MRIEREFFTPPQISAMTGMKQDNILDLIHRGELKAYNTALDPNGQRPRWRISRADLEAFLESRANKKPDSVQPVRRRRKSKPRRQWV
jgi:excisionase family DNA binding protein